jgi:tRNA_anti-like
MEPSQTVLVSAQDLAKEFEKSGADILKRAYDGKDMIVSGVIEDLREEFGRYRYAIMAGTAKTRVSVSVAEPRDFRELKVGQAVRLRGQDLFASEQQVKIQNGIVLPSK